jgi:hypothetical protein
LFTFKLIKFLILSKRNRGKQPKDDKWFAPERHPILTEAADDFGYLRGRHYSDNTILKVVGNRYRLNKRQRNALLRIAASEAEVMQRHRSMCQTADLQGRIVEIDGFNLLILLESALSGAFIFKARDGTYRDISSVHGSYKRVVKTKNAILLIGESLNSLKVKSARWYLDKPVSNSGKIKTLLREIGESHRFNWESELAYNPDQILADSDHIVITTDSWILDRVKEWFNMGAWLFEDYLKEQSKNFEIISC